MYAEDPFRKFLPSTGPLVTYREPTVSSRPPVDTDAGGGGVRVDAGVVEGSAVSMFYDPMISKLITYGDTREDALERLGAALDGERFVFRGGLPLLCRKDFLHGGLGVVVVLGPRCSSGFLVVVMDLLLRSWRV